MLCPALQDQAPHLWIQIRAGVKWCPMCNIYDCQRDGNVIPHPGSLLRPAHPDLGLGDGRRGKVLKFLR